MVWDPEEEDQREALEPLHYDVPPHLTNDLVEWTRDRLRSWPSKSKSVDIVRSAMRWERDDYGVFESINSLLYACEGSGPFHLSVVRAIMRHMPGAISATDLEQRLVRGNSGYAVRADGLGLEFRVPPAARDQVERAVEETPETVGQLLTKAWNAAYGMEPQPDVAWTQAIRATEAALRPVISPGSTSAQLGRLIADYEAKSEKWASSFEESRPTFDPAKHRKLDGRETIMQMARTLSYGQKQRHAGDEAANGLGEARAAVHLAITIAMACQEGTFRRVD